MLVTKFSNSTTPEFGVTFYLLTLSKEKRTSSKAGRSAAG